MKRYYRSHRFEFYDHCVLCGLKYSIGALYFEKGRTENNIIEKYLQSDIIKVVTGIRRCGKSVFCFMALRNMDFAYVNFDEKELAEAKNYDEILKHS